MKKTANRIDGFRKNQISKTQLKSLRGGNTTTSGTTSGITMQTENDEDED